MSMVPRRLEPRTLRLLAVRSNQLSYRTIDTSTRCDEGTGDTLSVTLCLSMHLFLCLSPSRSLSITNFLFFRGLSLDKRGSNDSRDHNVQQKEQIFQWGENRAPGPEAKLQF
jgi:hypothetical protein